MQGTGLGAPLDANFRRLSAPAYPALTAAERTNEARQVLVRSSQSLGSGSSGAFRPSQVQAARARARRRMHARGPWTALPCLA